MSHPDPLYDPDNSYDDDYECDEGGFGFCRGGFAMREDDTMDNEEVFEMDGMECGHEDGFEDDNSGEEDWYDTDDDSMDGDHESALASAGWGTDEDYGYYGEDVEDFHSDDGYGYYDDGE